MVVGQTFRDRIIPSSRRKSATIEETNEWSGEQRTNNCDSAVSLAVFLKMSTVVKLLLLQNNIRGDGLISIVTVLSNKQVIYLLQPIGCE